MPLNIAVTGKSGTGKSTLINTMRGLGPRDPGACGVGVTECTAEPTSYPHPRFKNFILWDLPGVGTPRFPQETYLSHIGVEKYEFFITLAKSRFFSQDKWLAKAMADSKKLFFYIRTHVDFDLENAKDDLGDDFDEKSCLDGIREECERYLHTEVSKPRVYLISNKRKYDTRWDFPSLMQDITNIMSPIKEHSFVLYLIANSKAIIEAKVDVLKQRIPAVVKVLSSPNKMHSDVECFVNEVTLFQQEMGLDHTSLEKIDKQYGVPLVQLEERIKQIVQNTNEAIEKMKEKLAKNDPHEKVLRYMVEVFGLVPLVGSHDLLMLLLEERVLSRLGDSLVKMLAEMQQAAYAVQDEIEKISLGHTSKDI